MSEVSQIDSKVIDIFKKQIEIEQKTLNRLAKLEEDAKETAVRLAFLDLRLDTWKHVKFLEGMIELLNTTPCDEWSSKVGRYAGRVKLERELGLLRSDENEMVNLLKKAIGAVDDPIAKLLLEHMKEEEKSHYNNLEKLVKLIQNAPLQSKKGEKGSDIVCDTD
jgi:bacterioferritin (cytochrome b1)